MNAEKPKLSARELEIAAIAWQCFKSEPQIDSKKLADLAGFKNPNSAGAVWNSIKKKLMGHAPQNNKSVTTPKSASKRKSGGTLNDGVPSKKPCTNASKTNQVPRTFASAEHQEEFIAETGEEIDEPIKAEK